MREPYSLEAEHGVLGAMMQRPELIDFLSEDLRAEDFHFAENAEVYRAIMNLQEAGSAVDFLTVSDRIGYLPNGDRALAYCGEIVKNTPSIANAQTYARIVHERAIDRALIQCGGKISEIGQGEQSSNEKIAAAQAELLSIDGEAAGAEVIKASDVLAEHIEELQRRHDHGDIIDGLSTGLESLDEKIQGLKPEQLIVLAGRPAMGKTTLAMNIATDVAIRQNKRVLVISLEMSNSQLMDRLLAAEGRIPLTLIKNGKAPQEFGTELAAAAGKINHAPLYLVDRSSMTISRIRAAARRHKRKYGLDLVVIDYLQLLASEGRSGNRVDDVTQMSQEAKRMARELKCPVILLSQLNRSLEQRPNKRPLPSDLRDSGAIEQDADIILFVYRDEVYNPDSQYKGIAEVIIGKGRDIETGTAFTAFHGHHSRFENLATGWTEPEPVSAGKVSNLSSRYGKGKVTHG